MKSVSELYQYNTDILRHSQEHFSEVLGLNFHLIRLVTDLTEFCYAVNQQLDLSVEFSPDIFVGHPCIFHDIMEKPGSNRLLI